MSGAAEVAAAGFLLFTPGFGEGGFFGDNGDASVMLEYELVADFSAVSVGDNVGAAFRHGLVFFWLCFLRQG